MIVQYRQCECCEKCEPHPDLDIGGEFDRYCDGCREAIGHASKLAWEKMRTEFEAHVAAQRWTFDAVQYVYNEDPEWFEKRYGTVGVEMVQKALSELARRRRDEPSVEEKLEKALRKCLHVIQKGIEVRLQDQWPALSEVLPDAVAAANEALGQVTRYDQTKVN